jgi:phosphoribosylglycinamide formyltransferase
MKAIHAGCESGQINGQISVVVTSSYTAGGVEWAMDRDIPVLLYPGAKSLPDSERISPSELNDYLKNEYKIDVVLLAGYLRLIPPELCRTFENKMLNIHPALLPAFGGKGMHGHKVHEAVVNSGARFTGPTVHFVNENFDEGKIVAQRSVRIDPSWTAEEVARRVLKEEHEVFPEVVAALCDGRIEFRDADGVGVIVDKYDESKRY